MASRIVIALGGNALGNSPLEQIEKINSVAEALVGLISQGYEIIISHGNGPQVGAIQMAFEKGHEINKQIPLMPLAECTAMSQGYIGYHLQNGILKELRRQKMPWNVSTMITQIEVSTNDEAFNNPTKAIGNFYSKEQAEILMDENPCLILKDDAGRGFRKMVASPKPLDIVEKDSILNLLDNEFIVIACGGGGIPVVKKGDGIYERAEAVIDKDLATAKLAELIDAEYLFILTAVDKVSINWNKPNQTQIDEMSVEQAEKYCRDGQFASGSMLPKVEAAVNFAKSKKGRKAVIASLEKAPLALKGESGTVIYW